MCLSLEHLTTSTMDRKIKKNCQIFQYLYPDSTANVFGGLDDNICLSCKISNIYLHCKYILAVNFTANNPSGREKVKCFSLIFISCGVSYFNKIESQSQTACKLLFSRPCYF